MLHLTVSYWNTMILIGSSNTNGPIVGLDGRYYSNIVVLSMK